jgi:hypothetical protein
MKIGYTEEETPTMPAWKGPAPYQICLVEDCDCVEYCLCPRTIYPRMDCDMCVRPVTREHRASLRRYPVAREGLRIGNVRRELWPLLAPLDRRWLDSTGDVNGTLFRLYHEYKRLILPRKRLTKAVRVWGQESPAILLSRLFPGKSDAELRRTADDEGEECQVRCSAMMSLGDCLMLSVGRSEARPEQAAKLYRKAYENHYVEVSYSYIVF